MGSPWIGELSDSMAGAVEKARRGLLEVRNGRRGAGAGVVWSDDGLIVTNAHVVGRGKVRAGLPGQEPLAAERVAVDERMDLALLRLPTPVGNPLERGDSRLLRPGQWVYALGHPWGVVGAATGGVVIGLGRPEYQEADDWLVLDLPLRPGNSGGPVIDAEGRMVGINVMMSGPESGVAIPVHVIEEFVRSAIV
jgi:S1-C subfamily serine protease